MKKALWRVPKLFSTLYNTFLFALYANLDTWNADDAGVMPVEERPEIDRWIISRLHALVDDYHADMDDFDVTTACRRIGICQ
jgi:isoleucyl-tRNA synthetase